MPSHISGDNKQNKEIQKRERNSDTFLIKETTNDMEIHNV